jgi:hypothetical protein
MRGTSYWPLYDFLDHDSRYALELAWATAREEEIARDGETEDPEGEEAEGDMPEVRATDGASAGVPSLQ